jgi:hypothetical protein
MAESETNDPRNQLKIRLDDEPTGSRALGNRPASGARQMAPGDILAHDFQGTSNAGDFLGLDEEFTGDSVDAPAPPAAVAAVDRPAASPKPSAPALTEKELEAALLASAAVPVPRASRRPLVLAGAFILGIGGVLGAVYGTDLVGHRSKPESDVRTSAPTSKAERPDPATKSAPGSASESGAAQPSDALTQIPASDTEGSLSAAPAQSETRSPEDGAQAVHLFGSLLSESLGRSEASPSVDASASSAAGAPGGLASASVLGPEDLRPISDPVAGHAFSLDFLQDLAWASEQELDMIWRGEAIAMEALASPVKIMMPRVGAVRVVMDSGEMFEGRLHAMGQDRVWIDAAPGRLGLDGARVARVEKLDEVTVTGASAGLPERGDRVRVRVPGGAIHGRVVAVEGSQVTFLTDEGARVTLEDPLFEEIGSDRAIVVR